MIGLFLVLSLYEGQTVHASLTQVQRINDDTAALYGVDVAASYNGTILVVGSPESDEDLGRAYVYTKSGSTWGLFTTFYSANVSGYSSRTGTGVTISGDASTIAYGEPGEVNGAGQVRVKKWNSGTSTYDDLVTVTPSDSVGAAAFGTRMAFCNGSSVLVVSGVADSSSVGAVWIFSLSGSSFTQLAKLVGTGNTGASQQGSSISITSDCSVLAIGGPYDSSQNGTVWVFSATSSSSWSQQGSKLSGSSMSRLPLIGTSVSLSSDGTRLAVGGPRNNYTGATWVFDYVSSAWTQTAYIWFSNVYSQPKEGQSVYLSQDGNTLRIASAAAGANVGLITTFTYSSSVWTQGASWAPTGYGSAPRVGMALASSGDETLLIAGAEYEDYNTGAAYIIST